ncbi:MAG: DMT family transporter [Rhodospirillales bacterium]|nr:DMT family transporter [Rhodospirillales bacterium]
MKAKFQALRGAPGAVRGIALMAAAMIAFAAMNGCVRFLSNELHPFQIAGIRSAFGLLIFVPILARRRLAPLRTQRIGLLAMRGFCHVVTMLLHFMALSLIPLATFASLNFSIPLFTTILAFVFLGEAIRLRRLVALGVGFAGALVVVRPGIVGLDVGAVLVLAGAASFAASVIILKHLVRTESSLTVTIYMSVVVAPATLIAVIPFWQTPTLAQLGLMAVMAGLGTGGFLLFTQAFKEADVTVLAPINFTGLIWSALFGYLAFGEVADIWTWVGGAMIFSATSYIAYRERRRNGRSQNRNGG